MAGKVVVRRRRCRRPLEGRRLPRIVSGLLALEHAPEEIEVENKLDCHRDDRSDRNEQNQWRRVLQELILSELCIATRHAYQAHRMERNEDRIDAEEGNPEMKLAQAFMHHATKHI